MLDRLMRRSVLAETNRVVRHDMNDALTHERTQPDRRTGIIREDEEGAGIRDDSAMQRHAIHCRGHAMLAHAIMDEAAGIIGGGQHLHRLRLGVIGACEVGRAADHFRHGIGQRIEREFRGSAGGDVLRRCRQPFL